MSNDRGSKDLNSFDNEYIVYQDPCEYFLYMKKQWFSWANEVESYALYGW